MSQEEEFSGNFYGNLRSLITLVDHLRDAGLQKLIRLPRIVTLGTQSSGKSSVLESIVGLNFLPRGDGVCTRRPLELRLVHTQNEPKPWAQFEGNDKKYINFDEVKEEIERQTDSVAGQNKGIVDDPIILTIYSETCPDLTLIDLPGITRIPLAGSDQGEDIEKITKQMAYKYISDPRTIILSVNPANADISTSEGLLMAKKVDKAGIRTIGVVTKIDIMDRGTNASKILLGQEIPLRLGYVGVKNRSQEDINNSVRVESALNEEKEFFARHPVYSTLPPDVLGTDNLTQKLTQVLFTHIRHILPEILKETLYRIKECETKLKELGPSAPVDTRQKTQLLWGLVTEFCELFKNSIRGKYDPSGSSKLGKDLAGGAAIRQYLNQMLKEYSQNYKATEGFTDDQILEAMIKHEGDNIPGFPSVDVFIFLLQPELEKLRTPVLDCQADVHSYLEQLARKIIERTFYRFPSLASEIQDVAIKLLAKERDSCSQIVESMIDSEEGYIFTNDERYLKERTDLIPKSDNAQGGRPEMTFVKEIRNRIDSYFKIVIRNVRDSIPKVIGHFLVRGAMNNMQLEMYEYINSNDTIMNLLSEPPHISQERESIAQQLEILRKAEKILKHDPNLAAQAATIESEIRQQEEDIKRQEEDAKNKEQEKKRREEEQKKIDEMKRKAREEPGKLPEEKKDPSPQQAQKRPTNANLFGDVPASQGAARGRRNLF